MLDHVILAVSDIERSLTFYDQALAPMGFTHAVDFDGADGPEGHPDLKGYSDGNNYPFWLRQGTPGGSSAHIGFAAESKEIVNAMHAAALAAGGADNGAPGDRPHYGYYAANVLDPDGHSLEFMHKG